MPDAFDRAMGIKVRTSADIGSGRWLPGMPLHQGMLWVGPMDGDMVLAFEVGRGQVLLAVTGHEVRSVRKVASGLNTIVEIDVTAEDGRSQTFTLVGPRGRMKKAFSAIGRPF